MITPPATYLAGGVISSQPRSECKGEIVSTVRSTRQD